MCRNIKPLRKLDHPVTNEEIYDAALQYVRKVSGYRKASRLNEVVFENAVKEIADATGKLLAGLHHKVTIGKDLRNEKIA